jgi:hypothetical protein
MEPVIAFTLCSNNYLAMACTWGESMLRQNPHVKVVIGLVDQFDPEIDYPALGAFEIIPAHEIGIPDFDAMLLRYAIIELNTSVKPFYFKFLFQRQIKAGIPYPKVCYFDPDIFVFACLDPIEKSLDHASILLTPHLLTPVPLMNDGFGEHLYLNYGIYNLGFCGLKWSPETERMLDWWAERLTEHCLARVEQGIFVDQLWINHVPIFFKEVEVSQSVGLNVAYWNLHERQLERRDGVWYVNKDVPLIFFHFSSFEFDNPDSLGRHSIRYSMQNRPEMRPFFNEYRDKLVSRGFKRFKSIPCAYVLIRDEELARRNRAFYLKHPFRLIADYWKSPGRLLVALAKSLPSKRRKPMRELTNLYPTGKDFADGKSQSG